MTNITATLQEEGLRPNDIASSLNNMKACVHRAQRLETLKEMLMLGVLLDAGRSVQEIMGRQV